MQPYPQPDLDRLKRAGVRVDIPGWMFGGNPEMAEGFARWNLRRDGDGWVVRNSESVTGENPGLITVSRVGMRLDPSNTRAYQRLSELGEHDAKYAGAPAKDAWDKAVLFSSRAASQQSEGVVSLAAAFRVLLMSAQTAGELPELAAQVMSSLTSSGAFPHASMHLIRVDDALGNRYGMTRALLQRERPDPSEVGSAFESSLGLMQDMVVGLHAYLEPLVTSLSPNVWGVTAPRAGGVVLLNFGQPELGQRQIVQDLLSLSRRSAGGTRRLANGEVFESAFRDAINWWISRLDLVLSHLTEPSNYEVDGQFDAPSALERLVNFEQICRSCQVIATADDDHATRLALFHVLDSLVGLDRSLDWPKLTKPQHNRKLLEAMRQQMPLSVQTVLLPRAEAGLEALETLQEGFFLSSRLTATGVIRPDKNGVETEVPLATATSEWLRVIRNSQHGYDKTPTPQARALLASHTGKIPPRLPDLAWFNLLRILTFPEILRRTPR